MPIRRAHRTWSICSHRAGAARAGFHLIEREPGGMNQRAFRLDFFIAIGALLVSALTAATLIYQTHVIGRQYAATIWPYLSITGSLEPHGETIGVENDGLGPALIESAQLSVDGKPASAWYDYLHAIAREPTIRAYFLKSRAEVLSGKASTGAITVSSIGPGSTIRPGASHTILNVSFPSSVPLTALLRHPITLDFCYCSLNGSCWNLHAAPGASSGTTPQSTAHCATSAAISARLSPPSGSLMFSK
jgi:hypothetical protein